MSLFRDKELFDAALAFKQAALADGWSLEPTYKSESVDRAASLTREGFKLSVITRHNPDRPRKDLHYEASVSGWGPDGLAIMVPREYSWEQIKRAVRSCNYCNARDVETFRVSFAGRCCEKCLPRERKRLETPGWTN